MGNDKNSISKKQRNKKSRQIQKLTDGNYLTGNNHTTHSAGLRREKEGKIWNGE